MEGLPFAIGDRKASLNFREGGLGARLVAEQA